MAASGKSITRAGANPKMHGWQLIRYATCQVPSRKPRLRLSSRPRFILARNEVLTCAEVGAEIVLSTLFFDLHGIPVSLLLLNRPRTCDILVLCTCPRPRSHVFVHTAKPSDDDDGPAATPRAKASASPAPRPVLAPIAAVKPVASAAAGAARKAASVEADTPKMAKSANTTPTSAVRSGLSLWQVKDHVKVNSKGIFYGAQIVRCVDRWTNKHVRRSGT